MRLSNLPQSDALQIRGSVISIIGQVIGRSIWGWLQPSPFLGNSLGNPATFSWGRENGKRVCPSDPGSLPYFFFPEWLAASKMPWSTTECGSDGEGNFSECQTPDDGGSRNANTRRLRTAFSLEQISTLESSFKRHKYLGAAERRKLASKMQLSEVQVIREAGRKIWGWGCGRSTSISKT